MKKTVLAIPMSYKLTGPNGAPFFTGVEWMESALLQDYPGLEYYVLANDLLPEMLAAIVERNKAAGNRMTIEYAELNNPPDIRTLRNGKELLYTRFADIRNRVLDYVLTCTDADYFASIDSDIVTHPDMLTKLVQQLQSRPDYGIIAAIVNNTRRRGMKHKYPSAAYNFGRYTTSERIVNRGKRKANRTYTHIKRFKRGEFLDVDYTGACFVMRVDMLRQNDGIRWGPHKLGEDLYLCEQVRRNGYKVGVDTGLVTLHMMDPLVYPEDVDAFQRGEFI